MGSHVGDEIEFEDGVVFDVAEVGHDGVVAFDQG